MGIRLSIPTTNNSPTSHVWVKEFAVDLLAFFLNPPLTSELMGAAHQPVATLNRLGIVLLLLLLWGTWVWWHGSVCLIESL